MKHTSSLLLPQTWGLGGLLAFALLAPAAHAQTAYIDEFNSATPTDQFATIDLQTGTVTVINPALTNEYYSLGFGADGSLYGLVPDVGNTSLYRIDTATGGETFLTTFTDLPSAVFGGAVDSSGIFQALTAPDNNNDSTLFSVDPVAQTDTIESLTSADAEGLVAPDNAGNVYVSDNNVTASGYDGLDKVVIGTGGTRFQGDTGLYHLYSGFFSGGQLFTLGYDPNADNAEGVFTLNTTTGASTLVALTSDKNDIYASALAPAAAPEPSAWAAFAVGLVGLGALTLNARRRTHASAS